MFDYIPPSAGGVIGVSSAGVAGIGAAVVSPSWPGIGFIVVSSMVVKD